MPHNSSLSTQSVIFLHTADIHLGKTYRTSAQEVERYEDFFTALAGIVAAALANHVDFVLIAGDLFHTGQILPRTFARTIEVLQPLKDHHIPCIAIEGNHDWIHRRDSISWMEALSQMGYLQLLRPGRGNDGEYFFAPFDYQEGCGGHLVINGYNIYGLGYIGTQAGIHVPKICQSITTTRNILLFHVGIWTFSPVEIGNMKPEEALPLAETFDYVALGHGHKPYIVSTPEGKAYAYNPGSPECVNFGEERYDKGYYLVRAHGSEFTEQFCVTSPRPMYVVTIFLDGAADAEQGRALLEEQLAARLAEYADQRQPLLEIKLVGRVGFHPFELGRDAVRAVVERLCAPLHVEIKNHLSLLSREHGSAGDTKTLVEIEREVLHDLISSRSEYKGREDELVRLSLAIRDQVLHGDCEGEELLALLHGN